jgi:hypothetical protein
VHLWVVRGVCVCVCVCMCVCVLQRVATDGYEMEDLAACIHASTQRTQQTHAPACTHLVVLLDEGLLLQLQGALLVHVGEVELLLQLPQLGAVLPDALAQLLLAHLLRAEEVELVDEGLLLFPAGGELLPFLRGL